MPPIPQTLTETGAKPDATPKPVWLIAVLAGAIAANMFAVVTVNYWIYYARAAFMAAHPDYVAVQPPTISRAIADPAIGVPFAFWVSLSGVALIFGVLCLVLVQLRALPSLPFATAAQRRVMLLTCLALAPMQALSALGMYLLSNYRFPDGHDLHMIGSYVFFVAQALVIVLGLVQCSVLLRSQATMDRLESLGLLARRSVAWRWWSGFGSIGLVLAYLVLFVLKDVDFGVANGAVYASYVTVEPMVISSFLLFLTLFQTDLLTAIRTVRRG